MTVSDNCLDSANPSPARSKGPGNYCPNPDSQVHVSLIFVLFICGDCKDCDLISKGANLSPPGPNPGAHF